jgi:hypothetical protein
LLEKRALLFHQKCTFSLCTKSGGGGAPAPNAPRFRGLCIYNYHMQLYTIIQEDYILYNLCMLVHNLIHCQSPRARPLVFPVFYICFWENSHLHGSASFSSCSCNSSYGEFPQRRASFSLSYIAYIQFIRIYLCIHTPRDERLVNIIRIFIVFSRRFDHHQLYTIARSETRPIILNCFPVVPVVSYTDMHATVRELISFKSWFCKKKLLCNN